jgi:hypothetical protein
MNAGRRGKRGICLFPMNFWKNLKLIKVKKDKSKKKIKVKLSP